MPNFRHAISKYFRHQRLGTYRIRLAFLIFFTLVILAVGGIFLGRHASDTHTMEAPARVAPPPPPIAATPTPTPVIDPAAIMVKAVQAYKVGDMDFVRTSLASMDLEKVGRGDAWELAGLLQEMDGHPEVSMELFSRGIAVQPTKTLYYRRAGLHRKNLELEQALEDLVSAIGYAPTDVVLSNERLLLLIQMGRGVEVRDEVKSRTTTDKTPAGWIFALCGLALENGEYDKASELLTLAERSMNPKIFDHILNDPVISRHQARPEIFPFYTRNANKMNAQPQ